MPLFRTRSAAIYGVDALVIDVEVDMYLGSARDFVTVGLPDTAVRESRERIKSSLINSGFGYPNKAVTVNLAPANLRKEGAGFDLPMALGIMGAMGTIPANAMEDFPCGWGAFAGRRASCGAGRTTGCGLRQGGGNSQSDRPDGQCRRGRGCRRRECVWCAAPDGGRAAH